MLSAVAKRIVSGCLQADMMPKATTPELWSVNFLNKSQLEPSRFQRMHVLSFEPESNKLESRKERQVTVFKCPFSVIKVELRYNATKTPAQYATQSEWLSRLWERLLQAIEAKTSDMKKKNISFYC